MANGEHLAKLKKGVDAWNVWREALKWVVPNLSGAFDVIRDLGVL
jgi:hypothetical protein